VPDVPDSELTGLSVASVRLRDDRARGRVVILIELLNELERTAHVHATPSIVRFDAQARHLYVEFSDENLQAGLTMGMVTHPKFKAVDPRSRSTMHARLPRHLHELVAGMDARVPDIARLHIHEADEVEVMLAWSDTPYYPDPRTAHPTARLGSVRSWQKGTLHGHGRRVERP
jgi:hypothetical protein